MAVEPAGAALGVAAIIASVFVAASAHAQDGTVVLLVRRADYPGFALGLEQQLAGRNVHVETAESPVGATARERRSEALATLRARRSTAAVVLERDATGKRTVVALSPCGARSAPISPDDEAAQRALPIVAASLLDELFAGLTAGGNCEPTDVHEDADALRPRPATTAYVDDELPPIARRSATRGEHRPAATGLPPWVAIAGLAASAGLGAAAYLSLPAPAQRADTMMTWGVAGSGPPGTTTSDSQGQKPLDRTPSYALGVSAAVLAAASVVTAAFLTDWGGTDERDPEAGVAVAVTPRAASVAVAASF